MQSTAQVEQEPQVTLPAALWWTLEVQDKVLLLAGLIPLLPGPAVPREQAGPLRSPRDAEVRPPALLVSLPLPQGRGVREPRQPVLLPLLWLVAQELVPLVRAALPKSPEALRSRPMATVAGR